MEQRSLSGQNAMSVTLKDHNTLQLSNISTFLHLTEENHNKTIRKRQENTIFNGNYKTILGAISYFVYNLLTTRC